jgi:hypothetical protein
MNIQGGGAQLFLFPYSFVSLMILRDKDQKGNFIIPPPLPAPPGGGNFPSLNFFFSISISPPHASSPPLVGGEKLKLLRLLYDSLRKI